jgi:predicted ATPase/signal transduction histidine kinase
MPTEQGRGILAELARDAWTETLLAQGESSGKPYILRRPNPLGQGSDAAQGLLNEYELVTRFRLPCLLVPEGLEGGGANLSLRYGAVNGRGFRQTPAVEPALRAADAVASALGLIHGSGMVLGNLTPASVLVLGAQAWIIDLTRAAVQEQIRRDIGNPRLIGSDLPYLAPEQTGRMTRRLDYRADYYAFGVLLYQWLTGRLPFAASDPLDLIHAQLTQPPLPPRQINPEIPPFLSRIVVKLLAKAPEERYQSIEGLRADLRLAGELGGEGGRAERVPGSFDVPLQFPVPHRMYGRESQRRQLLDCFDRAYGGGREILLISGYSGIGKTTLIRETYVPVARRHSLMISGKSSRLQRNLPYGAWLEALQKLIDILLAEPDDRMRNWRDAILQALGKQAGVLTALLPGLATLLGPQPSPPELPPAEAMERFSASFRRFMGVFCRPESPLVVFLDDLQWIDTASLNLLKILAAHGELSHLLVIGAYRDNAVSASHPLIQAIGELRAVQELGLTEITLPPLEEADVERLVADTFATSVDASRVLAKISARKTAGNPFFLWQFLRSLKMRGLVVFDTDTARWNWQADAIERIAFADNVADLMRHRFDDLPEQTRSCLAWAACLGTSFELDTLARLVQTEISQLHEALQPAVGEEFIRPVSSPELGPGRPMAMRYRFTHDRMQETAYGSLPRESLGAAHQRIARLLIDTASETERESLIFVIADHLKRAVPLLKSRSQRLELARISLTAARKAKASAAYSAALDYLKTGMAELPEDLWETEADLAYELFRDRGELEYLNADFEQAQDFVQRAIDHEPDRLRRAQLHHQLVVQFTLRARYPEAMYTARRGLELFDVRLPERDYEAARNRELARTHEILQDRPWSCLSELPAMTDPEQRAVMLLLTGMGPPSYRSHPGLWGLIVAREVRMCLEFGAVPDASYSYPAFGGLLTHVGQGNGRICAELAAATHDLMTRFDSAANASVAHLMIGSSLRHWFAPMAQASKDFRDAYEAGMESGNLQYAAYGFGHNAYCRYFQGIPLQALGEETEAALDFSRQRRNLWAVDLTEGTLRIFGRLQGKTVEEPEPAYVSRCESHGNLQVLCIYFILRAEALLYLGEIPEAAASLREAAARLDSISTPGLLPTPQYFLLRLLLLADAPQTLGLTPESARAELDALAERFETWSRWCPENFAYAAFLARAEQARLDNRSAAATEYYDCAIEAARNQGLTQRVGLIASRAAESWRRRGKSAFASLYLAQARAAYRFWQADAVTRALDRRFGDMATDDEPTPPASHLLQQDLKRAMGLSQAVATVSSVTEVARLSAAGLMQLSGAQRAVLLLHEPINGLAVVADTATSEGREAGVTLDQASGLPATVVRYASRTGQSIRVGADDDSPLAEDPAFRAGGIRSTLCIPLSHLGQLVAVVYLEHRAIAHYFPADQVPWLEFVATQLAASLVNARLDEDLRSEARQRERLVEELRMRNAELARLGEAMAHHFQEPARRMASFAQHLSHHLHRESLNEKARMSLDFIDQQARRLIGLQQTMQRYLALDAPATAEPVECDRLWQCAVQTADAAKVEIRIAAPLPQIFLPPGRGIALFAMLLDNAVRYAHPDRTLRVTISAQIDDGRAVFRLSDNGSGIAPEYRERVFDLFTRLVPGGERIGMGLAMARKIVAQSGGCIYVDDGPEGGTCVVFDLPAGNS